MNLLGKIFTFFIFVASLALATSAVAVYGIQKNWRQVVMRPRDQATGGRPLGLKYQLDNVKQINADLKEEKAELEAKLDEQEKAVQTVRAKFEQRAVDAEEELKKKAEKLAELEKKLADGWADVKVTHDELDRLRDEIDVLNQQIKQAEQDRQEAFDELVKLTEEQHQAAGEVERLKKVNVSLTEEFAKAKQVLQKFGLVGEPSLYSEIAPDVNGIVTAVPQPDLVEINIGSDDGLLKGHKLEVVRRSGGRNVYVGRIKVAETAPDHAVCRVDPNPEFRRRPVLEGDIVSGGDQLAKP